MASVQEVISSGDVEKIKQRRTACKRMLAVLNAQLDTKLVKSDNKFDHSEIERNKVLDDFSKVKRYYSEFEELHFAYLSSLPELEDEQEENKVLDIQAKYYNGVCAVAQSLLGLFEDYESSYKSLKGAESDLSKNNMEEESKVLAQQSVQNKIIIAERTFKRALLEYTTNKEDAQGLVNMVADQDYSAMIELTNIRGLPILDTKEALMKSMDTVTSAADQYLSALEAQHGVGKAEDKITSKFDQGAEYNLVSQLKKRLHLMHSAVTESGLRVSSSAVTPLPAPASGISVLPPVTPRPSAIKIKLPSVSFSGLPRDFASFKKEFQEVVVPGRPDVEIGALLRDAVPDKHKHLLRNLDLCKHKEAMDILQEEFGKPEHVMSWVIGELSRLKLVTSDKLFVEFVEKLEKISRDMEAVGMRKDLMNARMISDIVSKLPPVISHKWAEFKVMNKVGDKSS